MRPIQKFQITRCNRQTHLLRRIGSSAFVMSVFISLANCSDQPPQPRPSATTSSQPPSGGEVTSIAKNIASICKDAAKIETGKTSKYYSIFCKSDGTSTGKAEEFAASAYVGNGTPAVTEIQRDAKTKGLLYSLALKFKSTPENFSKKAGPKQCDKAAATELARKVAGSTDLTVTIIDDEKPSDGKYIRGCKQETVGTANIPVLGKKDVQYDLIVREYKAGVGNVFIMYPAGGETKLVRNIAQYAFLIPSEDKTESYLVGLLYEELDLTVGIELIAPNVVKYVQEGVKQIYKTSIAALK